MDHDQVQNDISIIKNMIEKTRIQTAESGNLFIAIGAVWLVIPVLLVLLEKNRLSEYWWPVFLSGLVITLIIAVLIGIKENKKSVPVTYAKKLFSHLWMACGTVAILTGFVLPLAGAYPLNYISIGTWPIIGIGVYLSGVIYEIGVIRLLSVSWLIGTILMAFVTIPVHLFISLATMFFGFVLPGILFSRQHKNRSN